MSVPRYPEVRVRVESGNPSALVSALRQALRRAGVDRSEIALFSDEAMRNADPAAIRRVCSRWARFEAPGNH